MADQTFAVHCGFFDAINSDRTYSADEMNRPYKRVISNGVFATPNGTPSTDLQVTASSGMNIICKKGEGLFGDKWFENPSGIAITVPSNTGTVPRIDSVIVQVDTRTSGRVGNIVHRTGTPASSPVPPTINQVEGVIEYRLANIRVNAGVSAITQSMITDRRGSSDCPWVTSLIYQVDTSTLYDQWQAAYAEYFEQEKAIWNAWYSQLTEDLDVSMTLDRHTNTVTTTATTTGTIPIGLAYNHNTDILEVYINGLRAVEGTHYVVVDGDTSIQVENQLQIGQEVTFVVMRSVISGSATNITVLLQELESQIAGIAGGTPTVVDSVSAMTDTDKIYVLSSDSKWYYYSATASDWVIGGTYGGVPTDTTLTQQGMAADAKAVGDALADKADSSDVTALDTRVTAVEGALNVMEGVFDTETIDITPAESTSGKFVSADGVPTDSASCSYKTISIGSNLVGKTLSISGSSWINVRPYVFVGASGNKSFPSTYDSSPTQYTDIPFVPNELGTLYINIYASGSTIHIGKVTYEGITDAIDVDAIPVDEIVNEIKDATSFEIVNLGTLITSKLLNGNTGEITDGTNQIQRVTDYIPVTPNTAYLITTESNYSRGLYAWYDENKVFISGAVAASGSTYTHLYGERVTSPKDAAYIVIGFIYQNPYPFPILMKGNMTSAISSKRWTGKKWTIIGDSLSASYAVTGMHYHELIAGATGISRNNLSVSGTGYARGSSSFMAQALSVPVDSDVVTIFGSGNDASTGLDLGTASDTGTTTVAGCINTTIDNLISVKPIMQVGIITPTPWHNNMPYDNGWMEQYSNLIVEICKRRSIPCLDLYHCTGLDTNNTDVINGAYSHDGGNATHLDEVGQNFIAPRILHFMESLLIH